MKQNDANIDEHNKTNSVFSRIYLVPCASSVLFDDGEVHCRVYDLWLSLIYMQTIVWKWTGPLKILQYWYPYAKQIKVRTPHVAAHTSCYKTGKLAKKIGELLWFAKFAKVFSPPKFFTVWYVIFIENTWFYN